MSKNIAIIFGAGSKIGASVAKKLLDNSYKVVTVSRSDSLKLGSNYSNDNYLHIKGDLKDLSTVGNVFKKVRETFGEPRVIIYNAAATNFSKGEDLFDIDTESLLEHQNVNVNSVVLALKEGTESFKKLEDHSDKPKTFIYTGNIQNVKPFPFIFSAGIGKSGSFSALGSADAVFGKNRGFRYYYVDERNPDGSPVLQGTSGEGAAEFYFDLAENVNSDIPVEATFVTGKGYTVF